jgi:cation transport ATPase
MKLVELVTEAARAKPRVVQFADRMSGWFVVVVTLAATATFAAWWPIDPGLATSNAVALLIVACPCALGIATPLALAVAIGRAAQRGILIKSGHVLERLARAGTIVLDKTGTLTRGRMGVTRWWGDEAAGPLAAALESAATHPAGRAIADWAPDPFTRRRRCRASLSRRDRFGQRPPGRGRFCRFCRGSGPRVGRSGLLGSRPTASPPPRRRSPLGSTGESSQSPGLPMHPAQIAPRP